MNKNCRKLEALIARLGDSLQCGSVFWAEGMLEQP